MWWERTAIQGACSVLDVAHVFLAELLFVFQKTRDERYRCRPCGLDPHPACKYLFCSEVGVAHHLTPDKEVGRLDHVLERNGPDARGAFEGCDALGDVEHNGEHID